MQHVFFVFTPIEYMLFFTDQQDTDQWTSVLVPLVPQVNMLCLTVVFAHDLGQYHGIVSREDAAY